MSKKLTGKAKANARKKAAQQLTKQKVAEQQKLIQERQKEYSDFESKVNEFAKATGATTVKRMRTTIDKDLAELAKRPNVRIMTF